MNGHQPTPPADRHPDLLGLVRGELSNADVVAAADHLESCEDCRADLAETAVGHALLARTGRTLQPAAQPSTHQAAQPGVATPELRLPPAPTPPASRRWLRPVAAIAAAAALVAGTAGVTRQLVATDDPPAVAVPTPQTADLVPVEGSGGGRVEMVDVNGAVTMKIQTRDLPQIKQGEFFQVWLFNPKTGKMLSLGILGPGGTGGFEVPDSLVGRYQVVDVSLESDDGDPGHSVTSVLRADYTDPKPVSS